MSEGSNGWNIHNLVISSGTFRPQLLQGSQAIMKPAIHKVTCFILRKTPQGRQLLLFRHPHAGIQIPAGTVAAGEKPRVAAAREAREESGLDRLTLMKWLGDEAE